MSSISDVQSTSSSNDQHITNNIELVFAAHDGCIEDVLRVLDEGCAVDSVDDDGSTALNAAAWGNQIEICKLLLKRGADPNVANLTYGWTPLFAAAARGHDEIAKLLIDAGADVDMLDVHHLTPFDYAENNGRTAVASILRDEMSKRRQSTQVVKPVAVAASGEQRSPPFYVTQLLAKVIPFFVMAIQASLLVLSAPLWLIVTCFRHFVRPLTTKIYIENGNVQQMHARRLHAAASKHKTE